jgi:hypothetical protein
LKFNNPGLPDFAFGYAEAGFPAEVILYITQPTNALASEAVTIISVGRGAVNAKSQLAPVRDALRHMAFRSRLAKKSFCACKMDFFRT